MAKEIKCYRCGKIHELDYKNINEIIECSHCHGNMHFSKSSRTKAFILKYVLLVLFVFLINIIFAIIGFVNFTAMMVIIVIVGVFFTTMIDKPCIYLTYRFLGGSYDEFHPADPRKKSKKNK